MHISARGNLLPLIVLFSLVNQGSAQTLRGRVQDYTSREPLAVVDLTVLASDESVLARARSDSLGDFVLRWTGQERVRLRADRLGFRSSTTSVIEVKKGQTLNLRMFMSTTPIPVEPVVISGRHQAGDIMGNFEGIERRRKLGIGKFVTREQIEQSGSSTVAEALSRVPGIFLQPEPGNTNSVIAYAKLTGMVNPPLGARGSRRDRQMNPTGGCPMMLFLDGRIYRYSIAGVNVLPAIDIEIIEVYRGLSEVPAEFSGEHARCGVIALWTRRRIE